jgi:putative methyltransferase (TIGR04325 family)
MSGGVAVIPVALFAYARPSHLARVLACLRENRVPLIYAFADGAKGPADAAAVAETRALLRAIDWCEVRLVERAANCGLGRNVLAGVEAVAAEHEAFVVWEDDLVCVPGTYDWMCAALRRYAADGRVMSVSAWTHPRVTPADAGDRPYLDARADCWVWGAWARSWRGMAGETALEKMRAASRRGIAPHAYGADLPEQAGYEQRRNVWAVRWLYHHFLHGGLCVRPPWSMVEHIGFDASATNAAGSVEWANPPLSKAPPVPASWPEPVENPRCRALWQAANPGRSFMTRVKGRLERMGRTTTQAVVPARVRDWLRRRLAPGPFRGDYATWAAASARATGYDTDHILDKAVTAARAVRSGHAVWERDTVLFYEEASHAPLLKALQAAAAQDGRLSVLDFGGALGSTWWQHRRWLSEVADLRWSVVEQPGFVAAGRREFATDVLRFYETVDACFAAEQPTVILLSSVLPYLEDPHALLAGLAARDCAWLIIDRTGFTRHGRDQLTVQHVPEAIYRASYPCWFFDRTKLLAPLQPRWQVVDEWASFDNGGEKFNYQGLLLQRTGPAARART